MSVLKADKYWKTEQVLKKDILKNYHSDNYIFSQITHSKLYSLISSDKDPAIPNVFLQNAAFGQLLLIDTTIRS